MLCTCAIDAVPSFVRADVASWTVGRSPRSSSCPTRYSRTSALAAEPTGCGCSPTCSTWEKARSAENSFAGALAGRGSTGLSARRETAANVPSTSTTTTPIHLCLAAPFGPRKLLGSIMIYPLLFSLSPPTAPHRSSASVAPHNLPSLPCEYGLQRLLLRHDLSDPEGFLRRADPQA